MPFRAVELGLVGLLAALVLLPAVVMAQTSNSAGAQAPFNSAAAAGVAPPVNPLAPVAKADDSSLAPPTGGSAEEYVLGAEDVIEIEVVGTNDKSRAKIYTDGTIQMNLVGKISAAGKTPRQLSSEISQILKAGGYYTNPVVNVEVTNYASRYVTVLGAVASPSLVPINRVYHLSEILARVGGVQQTAADYVIVRPETGEEKRYLISELATGDAAKDPVVQSGDKIFAPVAEVFYISGQVNSPGSFPLRTNLTVRQAIGMAGGLTAAGSDKKVEANRGGKKTKLAGDMKVEAGDVLVVGERLF